jgi:hypothetical protein
LLPKVKKAGVLKFVEGLVVVRGKIGVGRRRCRAGVLLF